MLLAILYCFTNLSIEVIAPSSGADETLWKKVEKLIGKKCNNKNLKSSNEQVFEDPEKKFKILDKQLRSDKKILWAIRGGYGCDKIMPFIIKNNYRNIPKKTIVGYSDLTTLQIYLSQEYGWKNVSGLTIKEYFDHLKSKKSKKAMYNYLSGENKTLVLNNLKPLNKFAEKSTKIIGKTTGGNMTSIDNTIGTPWQIQTKNKILFLEDVNVEGYQLDRVFVHFRNVGIFNNVKAIILGNFGNEKQNKKVYKKFAKNINIPVFQTNNFGHQKENLPFGINFDGIIEKSGSLFKITMT